MRKSLNLTLFLMFAALMLSGCQHHGPHKPTTWSKLKRIATPCASVNSDEEDDVQNEEDDSDGPPLTEIDVTHIPNATPKLEPLSRYGNPSTYEVLGSRYHVMPHCHGYQAEGTASWYGRKFHGQRTSSGETYDMFGMTAAHRSLPLPTYAKVKNLNNGREVIVKINDRGPFVKDRLIDLSYAAAKKLGIHLTGTAKVVITAIDPVAWHKRQKETQLAKKSTTKPVNKATQPITLAAKQEIIKPITNKTASSAAKPQSAKPAAKKKSDPLTTKQIYIQLGSFSKKANAQQLASRASTLTQALSHVDVHVLPNKVSNKNLYKVRVGPIKNKAEAKKLQQKLLAINNTGSATLIYD